jgi:hypothetical protein
VKLLKGLGSLLKTTQIYLGWVVEDIQRHDFRALLSGIRARAELEAERTTYTTVYGYGLQWELFSHVSVGLETAMLGMSWRLGRHGVEEIAASNYTNGLWKALRVCGLGEHAFRSASEPVLRSFYRGHMNWEDCMRLREFLPLFSKFIHDRGISIGDRISVALLSEFLGSHA